MAVDEIKTIFSGENALPKVTKAAKKEIKSYADFIKKTLNKSFFEVGALGSVGKAIKIGSAAAVASIGAVGVASIKMNMDVNKGMANVASLIPDSLGRIKELKGDVQSLSIEVGKSTTDLANGLYEVVSAFGDTSESAEKLRISAQSATAGVSTTLDAVKLNSAVMKAYGDTSAKAMGQISDLAFMTVKLGQTNFPALAQSIGNVTSLSEKLGLAQKELFTVFATLTGVTGDASIVSTQMAAILRAMMAPTEAMAAAMKTLEFNTAETMIKALGLKGSLDALIATTDGSSGSIRALFGRAEALNAVFAITGKLAGEYTRKLFEMGSATGAMKKALEEQTGGINRAGFQWEVFKSSGIVALERIGEVLEPFTNNIINLGIFGFGSLIHQSEESEGVLIDMATFGIGAVSKAVQVAIIAIQGLHNAWLGLKFVVDIDALLLVPGKFEEFELNMLKINDKYNKWGESVKKIEKGLIDIGDAEEDNNSRNNENREIGLGKLRQTINLYEDLFQTIKKNKEVKEPELLTAGALPSELSEVATMDQRLKEIESFYDAQLATVKKGEAGKARLTALGAAKNLAIENQTNQMRVAAQLATVGMMSNILQSLYVVTGENNKALFYAYKAFAFGEAIISAELGAAKALTMGPIGVAMAPFIRGMGYANAAAIAATALTGGGGGVGAGSGGAKSLPTTITEMRESSTAGNRSSVIGLMIEQGKTNEEIITAIERAGSNEEVKALLLETREMMKEEKEARRDDRENGRGTLDVTLAVQGGPLDVSEKNLEEIILDIIKRAGSRNVRVNGNNIFNG